MVYCKKFPVSVIVVVSTFCTVISNVSIIPVEGGGGGRGTPSDGDDRMGVKVRPKKVPTGFKQSPKNPMPNFRALKFSRKD